MNRHATKTAGFKYWFRTRMSTLWMKLWTTYYSTPLTFMYKMKLKKETFQTISCLRFKWIHRFPPDQPIILSPSSKTLHKERPAVNRMQGASFSNLSMAFEKFCIIQLNPLITALPYWVSGRNVPTFFSVSLSLTSPYFTSVLFLHQSCMSGTSYITRFMIFLNYLSWYTVSENNSSTL